MTRAEEIEQAMLEEMSLHGFEDTPQNRHDFLQGLYDGWKEDPDTSMEKTMYLLACQSLMLKAVIQLTLLAHKV